MIELRWVTRDVRDLHPMTNIANGYPRETVLQYRVQDPTVHGPAVWHDVPTVSVP